MRAVSMLDRFVRLALSFRCSAPLLRYRGNRVALALAESLPYWILQYASRQFVCLGALDASRAASNLLSLAATCQPMLISAQRM